MAVLISFKTTHDPNLEDAVHSIAILARVAGLIFAGVQPPQEGRITVLDSVVTLYEEELPVPEVDRIDDVLGIRGRMVSVGDARLYVIEEGEGIPMVLVNGGPGNTLLSFLPHFSRAAEFARLTYYDQRGTGRSDWKRPPGGYSTAQAVRDLDALREALGIQLWVVLGHSYGGLIAQRYALAHPNRTAGLVLVSSSVPMDIDLGGRDHRMDAERRRIREAYSLEGDFVVPTHSDRADLETVRRMVFNGYMNGDWKRQYFYRPTELRMAHIAHWEWHHDRNFNAEVRGDGFEDLTGRFQGETRTLIIEGRWDPNWGAGKPERFAAQHPGSRLVVVDSASHFSFEERPEPFFRSLRDFLAGLRR